MSWKYLNKTKPSSQRLYQILRAPVITEKSTLIAEHNQYVFYVAPDANKNEIKAAVETLFKVSVKAVNVINMKGKNKRFRGFQGRRNDKRKAIVTLADNQSADFTAGI